MPGVADSATQVWRRLQSLRSRATLQLDWQLLPITDMPDGKIVYILRSNPDPRRYDVGLTSDLSARLGTHNSGGSAHTRRDRPWQLVVSLEFTDASSVVAFERYLKSGSGRAFAKRHFVQGPVGPALRPGPLLPVVPGTLP